MANAKKGVKSETQAGTRRKGLMDRTMDRPKKKTKYIFSFPMKKSFFFFFKEKPEII